MQVIELGTNLPAGYATESVKVTEPEHMVRVSTRGFASTADGHSFVRLLEQFPTELLSKLTEQPRPSQADNLLAIISPTGTANVYVNEVSAILTTKVRRSVKAGQPVSTDDISEIQKMEFCGIDVPSHTGIIYFFTLVGDEDYFTTLVPYIVKKYSFATMIYRLCWVASTLKSYSRIALVFQRRIGRTLFGTMVPL